ncbi:hypothetical protein AXG93_3822s1550 [Marchantia polymorpha subsp. ruderalis]|uniref:Uncharacterized protein n=1 Tax=Marchantia polymorpha subsp. ruderalis TaxID=1480154 RepID=A0A176WK18_MARPO|nr:hypothetical protein AXG93_3822s1550 [Marchantia polymorpha subsp. ruderalis]
MTHMHALSKVNPQSRRKEVLDNAECNETTSQPQLSSDHWTAVEMHDTETKDEWPLKWRSSNVHKEKPLAEGEKEEDKTEMESSDQHSWSSGERTSDVREEIEKSSKFSHSNEEPSKQFAATVTEKPTLPLCQVSLETVEFDRGEGHLICKQKSAEFSLLDILSERLVSIVKFLDRKMVKYLVSASSAGSYVVLREFQLAEQMIGRLVAQEWMMVAEVAYSEDPLDTCEAARSLGTSGGTRVDGGCRSSLFGGSIRYLRGCQVFGALKRVGCRLQEVTISTVGS